MATMSKSDHQPPEPTQEERIERAWHQYRVEHMYSDSDFGPFSAGYLAREAEDADREHLERAAQLLREGQGLSERAIDRYLEQVDTWLEAERLRRQKRGPENQG